ncbi:anaerobic sulfatase maturase [Bacillus pseudomycoides]|uniref:anaerobic sulfatase maturase n=1 Tax=Bacillus pseudomycoides TaxID=64104 RepID=UPI000BEB8F69|nr:anaerobic sulfatase maturase [Bacillus pseudomycoides]PEE35586.1 anaerobic sulfatase maturase [Bacillus pseudomycoides]PGA90414.1 anaerobic sulfatase maturase [Bacillus pseudomycoides]PHF51114.1 anaerobic sulfatase maturase [Bacillus pseudomycoides]
MGRCNSFHILVKPTGPICNLDCKYCYYTEKEIYFPNEHSFRMSDSVLESYIKQYIASQDTQEIVFAWQGGEPTLMGLDFFHKAISLQKKYADGKQITNTIQTNGTLLNDRWCEFFSAHHFLVGLSLDGPEYIHDMYRIDRGGKPTFELVMKAIVMLKKHGVEFNILTCVTRHSSYRPLEIYRFFKQQDIQYIQFIPIVEREVNQEAAELSLRHATPPFLCKEEAQQTVTPWTVEPEMYGEFLIQIFTEWVQHDVGSVYVMNFEWALASWIGIPSPVCIFSEECGRAVAMEHNGDLFSCDHYVYPEYRLGNITDGLVNMINSPSQLAFGKKKRDTLPSVCRNCEVRFACHGECPKNRFLVSNQNEPGLNYLCVSYKKYFKHINPYMKMMKQLLQDGLPVSYMKEIIADQGGLSKI